MILYTKGGCKWEDYFHKTLAACMLPTQCKAQAENVKLAYLKNLYVSLRVILCYLIKNVVNFNTLFYLSINMV